jgi:hypothetical protein
VRLLAIQQTKGGLLIRAQAAPGQPAPVSAKWLGKKIALGPLAGGEIGTWKLRPSQTGWNSDRSQSLLY